MPLARSYGAALVVGSIDEDPEQGMAVTRERKLEVARRSLRAPDREVRRRRAEDICFDPLVFPCGTGDENYVGSAVETIEGVRADQGGASRGRKTILGISQRLLRPAGRRARGAQLGLPLPLRRRPGSTWRSSTPRSSSATPSIPEEERRLAEDLLFNRGDDPIAAFAAHFRGRKTPRRDGEARAPAAARRAAARATSSRARRTGSSPTSSRSATEARPARDHQRPADGRAWTRSAGSSTPTS